MKHKIYTSLLLGLGLTFASAGSFAKPAHNAKKTQIAAPKHDKAASKKSDAPKNAAKKQLTSLASKDKRSQNETSHKKNTEQKHAKKEEHGKHSRKDTQTKLSKREERNKRGRKTEHETKLSRYKYSNQRDDDRVHEVIIGKNADGDKPVKPLDLSYQDQNEWGQPFEIKNGSSAPYVKNAQALAKPSNGNKFQFEPKSTAGTVLQTQDSAERRVNLSSTGENRVHALIGTPSGNSEGEVSTDSKLPQSISSVHVTFDDSLSLSHQAAALSDDMIAKLAEIFAWDVDFSNNIHPGDQLTVVYEKNVPGNNVSPILAAQYTTDGKTVTAMRYIDPDGKADYYTPEGKSLRKTFLSSPVDYIKISSHFDPHRRHPILNRIRAHKGVDYAARTGTPVKSAGDGTLTFVGNKGAYGQVMIVEHGAHYETLYAHLSGFKKGLEVGAHVKQGEVIAYVGQTGLATGPHLHYEFHVDGVYHNPETVTMNESLPIDDRFWSDFHSKAVPVLTQLNQAKSRSLLAKNQ